MYKGSLFDPVIEIFCPSLVVGRNPELTKLETAVRFCDSDEEDSFSKITLKGP